MQITFLHHSGFLVDDGVRCYVFDYWKDPAGVVAAAQAAGRTLWFFVTHNHGDHYSPAIGAFDASDTVYVLHQDVPFTAVKGHTIRMEVGDHTTYQEVPITMYGSTDLGGSFLIETAAGSFYHAGDLNWWHWLGDTEENNREARRMWERELQRMRGLAVDYACFPVDSRMNYEDPCKEGAREWGLLEWLDVVQVHKLFIAMHQHDLEKGGWQPSLHVRAKYPQLSLWVPRRDGESYSL